MLTILARTLAASPNYAPLVKNSPYLDDCPSHLFSTPRARPVTRYDSIIRESSTLGCDGSGRLRFSSYRPYGSPVDFRLPQSVKYVYATAFGHFQPNQNPFVLHLPKPHSQSATLFSAA